MSDYKPETVAVVTFQTDDMLNPITQRGIRWQRGWSVVYDDGAWELIHDRAVSDVRPLVVLDPEDREACREFADRIAPNVVGNTNAVQAALRDMVKPPKPPEPQGLGAVVEDSKGNRWVRAFSLRLAWTDTLFNEHTREYADIDAVRVLSDGVRP